MAQTDKKNQLDMLAADTRGFNADIAKKSIVSTPTAAQNAAPRGPIVFNIATAADEFTPWGYDVASRDAQLRSFWHTEPLLASAVYSMSARLAVVDWKIEGIDPTKPKPRNTVSAVEQMLKNADYGEGWMDFITKVAIDIYTQDNGAFIELVRQDNDPKSAVISINHLDSARCFRTGDREAPVRYQDKDGVYHELKWWNVIALTEMPSPIETMYSVGYSAVTRALRAAQIIRDIAIYKKEKVSGQFMRTIHFVSGVSDDNIEAAMALSQERQLNLNLYRYAQPAIVATLDPDTTLQHEQIDLASLPDGFDEEITLKWYISQLALAFGVDYQEFAPLPGGNLGSGQQAEILHLKSRGKGPALLMSRLENIFNNFGILPKNVKFEFTVQDSRAEAERAAARFERGKDRSARVQAGELDAEGARELAVLDGDLPEWMLDIINKRIEEKKKEEKAQADEQLQQMQQSKNGAIASPPISATNQQTQGGINSQMKRSFDNDDFRAAILRRLLDSGVISAEQVQITAEDIAAETRRLQKKGILHAK
jgi:hypothetical protein